MIFYITVLRALAAILITNAHYTGVYPIEIIANGGLLGDVIFFCVSGFCLYNIKQKFPQWYSKRIIRIYPTVWIITGLYLILGFYSLKTMNIFEYFIYPTYYHFIASIILLYIIYYIIIKNDKLKNNIGKIMIGLAFIHIIVYVLFYDKGYYHIDTVREPMIRFLFLQSMLLGAYFRKNYDRYEKNTKIIDWIKLVVFFIIYFASKLAFSRIDSISNYQIINQIILFILLYYFMKCFAGINKKLEKMPNKIKKIIKFISEITLEIYLVQYVIIPIFANMIFPINWIIITTIIIISAYILHKVSGYIINLINTKILKIEEKNESISNRVN